jgi:hypothetical protein
MTDPKNKNGEPGDERISDPTEEPSQPSTPATPAIPVIPVTKVRPPGQSHDLERGARLRVLSYLRKKRKEYVN